MIKRFVYESYFQAEVKANMNSHRHAYVTFITRQQKNILIPEIPRKICYQTASQV